MNQPTTSWLSPERKQTPPNTKSIHSQSPLSPASFGTDCSAMAQQNAPRPESSAVDHPLGYRYLHHQQYRLQQQQQEFAHRVDPQILFHRQLAMEQKDYVLVVAKDSNNTPVSPSGGGANSSDASSCDESQAYQTLTAMHRTQKQDQDQDMDRNSSSRGSTPSGSPSSTSRSPSSSYLKNKRNGAAKAKKSLSRKQQMLEEKKKHRADAERRRFNQKKAQVEIMRREVDELEQQFEQLCCNIEQNDPEPPSSTECTCSFCCSSTSATSNCFNHLQHSSIVVHNERHPLPTRKSLVRLFKLTEQLREENAQARKVVEQYEAVAKVFEAVYTCEPSAIYGVPFHTHPFHFVPLTRDHVNELICDSYGESLAEWERCGRLKTPQRRFMRWIGNRFIDDSNVARIMLKVTTHNMPPTEIIKSYWRILVDDEQMFGCMSRPIIWQTLQEIDENVHIVRRVCENTVDGSICHAIYLIYRLDLENGDFMLGYRSLSLDDSGMAPLFSNVAPRRESIVNLHCWLKFQAIPDNPNFVETNRPPPSPATVFNTRSYKWGRFACESRADAEFWQNEWILTMQKLGLKLHLLLTGCPRLLPPSESVVEGKVDR